MQQKYKLTNLELSNFGGEHVHDYWLGATIGVLRYDDQLDLATRVQTSDGEAGSDTGHIGQCHPAHPVHHLQHEALLQPSIKPRLTLHLEQLRGLRQRRSNIFLPCPSNNFQSADCILTLKLFEMQQ